MTKRTTRLAHGENSIYYERSGDRYVRSMDLGRDGNGRRRRAKVTGATRDEVALKLRARRAAIETGDAAPSAMTVAALSTSGRAPSTVHPVEGARLGTVPEAAESGQVEPHEPGSTSRPRVQPFDPATEENR